MKTCYLALPYSHWCPLVRWWRYRMANKVAAALIKAGYNVFSPISHSHGISRFMGNQNESGFWQKIDEYWQRQCNCFAVLPLSGTLRSKGLPKEFILARRFGQELLWIDPVTFEISEIDF